MGNSHLRSLSPVHFIPLLLFLMTIEDKVALLEKPAAMAMQKGVSRKQIQRFIFKFL